MSKIVNVIRKSSNSIVRLNRDGIIDGELVRIKNGVMRIMFTTKKDRLDFNDFDINEYYLINK